MKITLLERAEIRPGLIKEAGTAIIGLPDAKSRSLIAEGKAELFQEDGLPKGYPAREMLVSEGFNTADAVNAASDEELLAIDGIGPKTLTDIRNQNEE